MFRSVYGIFFPYQRNIIKTIPIATALILVSLFVIPLQLTYAQTISISFSQQQCVADGSAFVTVMVNGLEQGAFGFVVDNFQTYWGSAIAVPTDTMFFGPNWQFDFGTHSFLVYQDLNVNFVHDPEEPSASTAFTVSSCQSQPSVTAAIENLIGLVQSLGINVGPLSQVVTLLKDNNANNDVVVCSQLNAIINEVNAKMQTGKLMHEQAEQLLQAAQSIKGTLKCS